MFIKGTPHDTARFFFDTDTQPIMNKRKEILQCIQVDRLRSVPKRNCWFC